MEMQLVFSDAQYWEDFLPLTFTRPVSELRMGILTFQERWKKLLEIEDIAFLTEDYLQEKFKKPELKESLLIVPNFLPTESVLEQIKKIKQGEALIYQDEVIVAKLDMKDFSLSKITKMIEVEGKLLFVKSPSDIFTYNQQFLDYDFELLTRDRKSQELSETNNFLEKFMLVKMRKLWKEL